MNSLLMFVVFASLGFAQGQAVDLIERLNRMSPTERRRVLDRMPPARRQLLENRINNFNKITPEARQKLRKDYESFQQLPPEKQDEARRTMRLIAELPVERRRAVRGAVNHLRQQPLELRQRRMASRGFENRFSTEEQKLVRDAVALLPAPETPQQ